MKVYVVTAWNDTQQEDYVGVFATRKLATAAWKKIKADAAKGDKVYGGISVEPVVGFNA